MDLSSRVERSRASRPGLIRASRIHPDLAREASRLPQRPPVVPRREIRSERPVTRRNIPSRHTATATTTGSCTGQHDSVHRGAQGPLSAFGLQLLREVRPKVDDGAADGFGP